MLVKCEKCGQQYERFNTGGYQSDAPHICLHACMICSEHIKTVYVYKGKKLCRTCWEDLKSLGF